MSFIENTKPYAKAIVGTGVAFLGTLGTALADGVVSPIEWVGIASATLIAAGAVWGISNGAETVVGSDEPPAVLADPVGAGDALVPGDSLGDDGEPKHSA